jgi:hypothetical protein
MRLNEDAQFGRVPVDGYEQFAVPGGAPGAAADHHPSEQRESAEPDVIPAGQVIEQHGVQVLQTFRKERKSLHWAGVQVRELHRVSADLGEFVKSLPRGSSALVLESGGASRTWIVVHRHDGARFAVDGAGEPVAVRGSGTRGRCTR